eukprot:6329671-Pyramimonas_sp.AAC.1
MRSSPKQRLIIIATRPMLYFLILCARRLILAAAARNIELLRDGEVAALHRAGKDLALVGVEVDGGVEIVFAHGEHRRQRKTGQDSFFRWATVECRSA